MPPLPGRFHSLLLSPQCNSLQQGRKKRASELSTNRLHLHAGEVGARGLRAPDPAGKTVVPPKKKQWLPLATEQPQEET
eukprot:1483358-Pleurochrysis_carterae.AAC.2